MPTDTPRPPVVLVTGASSGFGKACAELLFARGCRVYGTSRQAPRALVEARTSDLAPLLRLIPLDVTSDASVEAAVGLVLACEGRIDALVNNAGYGLAGAAELTTIEEAREQFETNFFGTMRVCRAVLPIMRQQGRGHILNVSSIAGRIGIPFQALYCASKFAVEGFTEALRMEVAPLGVRVVLIEPGDFRTGFTASRRMARDVASPVYSTRQAKALAVMEHDEMHGTPPEAAARLVHRVITSRSPRARYAVGPPSELLALALRRFAPGGLFERGLALYYRVR
jgi:NAD(P)-dependent dehydrogenase (short-subunit alcohol dehydrogenase family)